MTYKNQTDNITKTEEKQNVKRAYNLFHVEKSICSIVCVKTSACASLVVKNLLKEKKKKHII